MSTTYKDIVAFDPNKYYVGNGAFWTHDVPVYSYQTASITLDINVWTYNDWGVLDLFVSDDTVFDWENSYVAQDKPEFAGRLSISAGPPTDSGFRTVTFNLKPNQLPWLNNDGSVYVALLGGANHYPGGFPAQCRLTDSTLAATTFEAPVTTTLAIAATSASKAEGSDGITQFTFAVTRAGSTSGASSVSWAVIGSGANPASADDFAGGTLPSGSLSFAAGETSKIITVGVAGDTMNEPNEGFTVTLANPVGAAIATASASDLIENDDAPPVTATFTGTSANETIGPMFVSATVTREPAGSFPSDAYDTIYGNGGNDTLDGGVGTDTLAGGSGDDLYLINDADTVSELPGQGFDTVRTTLSSYTLPVNVERLEYIGTGSFQGTGSDFNDVLKGGPGNDTLNGAGGSDTVTYSAAFRQCTVASGGAQVSGPDGGDTLSSIENLAFVDGRLTFDAADHMAQAYRLYFATLGREPDALGLNFQSARLDAGTALTDVAAGFVESPEFQATYGSLDDAQFVDLLYKNVLGRSPDHIEITYHVGRLQPTSVVLPRASRADVVVGFSEAPEHIQKHIDAVNAGLWDIDEGLASIARLYFGMLERTPETAGLAYYKDALAQGLTVQQVANNFSLSPEFFAKYGPLSDPDYVTQLYENVLERSPAPAEVDYHVNRLVNGAMRGDVAAGFTEALEYQLKTLTLVDDGIAVANAGFVLA